MIHPVIHPLRDEFYNVSVSDGPEGVGDISEHHSRNVIILSINHIPCHRLSEALRARLLCDLLLGSWQHLS